jgi:hypothetical protein
MKYLALAARLALLGALAGCAVTAADKPISPLVKDPAADARMETRAAIMVENICPTVPPRAADEIPAATLNIALSRQNPSGAWTGTVMARSNLYRDGAVPVIYLNRPTLNLFGPAASGPAKAAPAADPADPCAGLVMRAALLNDPQGLHVAYTVDELDERPEFAEIHPGSSPDTPHSGLVQRISGDIRVSSDGTGFDVFRYVDKQGTPIGFQISLMMTPPSVPDLPQSVARAGLVPSSVEYDHEGVMDGSYRATIDFASRELAEREWSPGLFGADFGNSKKSLPIIKTRILSAEEIEAIRKFASKAWLQGIDSQACTTKSGPFIDLKVNAGGYQRRYSSPFLCMTPEALAFRKAIDCAARGDVFTCPGRRK